MASHHEKGNFGEFIGEAFLEKKGFSILERNWRSGRKEIDRIARKNETIHFIEIKTRFSLTYGWPEASVSSRKIRNMMLAGCDYLASHGWGGRSFDVLSIQITGNEVGFYFIENL